MVGLLFSLNGRIARRTYWLFLVAVIALSIVAALIDGAVSDEDGAPVFTILVSLLIIWPSIAVAVKRWHDRDKSGWWVLIALIPAIGPIWALIENGFLAGTPGNNRFGPSPLQAAG